MNALLKLVVCVSSYMVTRYPTNLLYVRTMHSMQRMYSNGLTLLFPVSYDYCRGRSSPQDSSSALPYDYCMALLPFISMGHTRIMCDPFVYTRHSLLDPYSSFLFLHTYVRLQHSFISLCAHCTYTGLSVLARLRHMHVLTVLSL